MPHAPLNCTIRIVWTKRDYQRGAAVRGRQICAALPRLVLLNGFSTALTTARNVHDARINNQMQRTDRLFRCPGPHTSCFYSEFSWLCGRFTPRRVQRI